MKCVFETDEQIDAGEILAEWTVQDVQIRSAPQRFMTEVTRAAKLNAPNLRDNWQSDWAGHINPYGAQIAVADFDQDGFPDIAVSTLEGQQILLKNEAGQSFRDVTVDVGLQKRNRSSLVHFATWIDFDNDSFPDLLIGESLYRNLDGRVFQNVTARSGLIFSSDSMGCAVADYDCDGLLDLFFLNHRLSMQTNEIIGYVDDDKSGAPNQLWHNEGGGEFRDATAVAGVGGGARRT
ncbi:MAG: VCBS repeat-containing protein, partial [Fuerstiella sp.]|nr:VCBS repeat-containing protein [Fuerstiella sp.]